MNIKVKIVLMALFSMWHSMKTGQPPKDEMTTILAPLVLKRKGDIE